MTPIAAVAASALVVLTQRTNGRFVISSANGDLQQPKPQKPVTSNCPGLQHGFEDPWDWESVHHATSEQGWVI